MSRFLTRLTVRVADDLDSGAWVLELPLAYQSDVARQTFFVPPGFLTDFASVPRLPFIYEAFGNRATAASVIHDFLYNSQAVSRSMADAVFREASGVQGVSAWKSWAMWLGVRLGGGAYWREPVAPDQML